MITVNTYFYDDDGALELEATFEVDSMAHAIDCPPEYASAYRGRYDLSMQRCINADTRAEHAPTPYQYEKLTDAVMEKIK
jgi:hypothetical protein